MNLKRGHRREDPEMNLIPLIDVLMVILIFLMVTTTYSRFAELQINLPEAGAEASPTRSKAKVLHIAVDSGGNAFVEKQQIPALRTELIGEALVRAANGAPDPVIAINADAGASHQSVINVMEAARNVGYTHITFATQTKK
jgi:biopolymer transport protein ExbD